MNSYANKYDKGLILLIGLLSLGGFGGAFQAVRLVSLAFLPFVFCNLLVARKSKMEQYAFLVLISWFLFSSFSIIWSLDRALGVKHAVYGFTHIILFFLVIDWAKKSNNALLSIVFGWALFLAITLCVAFYEILTFNHLPMNLIKSEYVNLGGEISRYRYASVTFGNHNTYTTILLMALSFISAIFFIKSTCRVRFLFFLLIVSAFFVIVVNGSRGGVLGIIMLSIFLFIKGVPLMKRPIGLLYFAMTLSFFFFIVFFFHSDLIGFVSRFYYRVTEGGLSLFSDSSRSHIYESALSIMRYSGFLGFGAGGEHAALLKSGSNILSSHNFFIEVLLQYGLPGLLLFCIFLVIVYGGGVLSKGKVKNYIVINAVLIMPVVFIINSGYLLMPALWVYFASIFIASNPRSLKIEVYASNAEVSS